MARVVVFTDDGSTRVRVFDGVRSRNLTNMECPGNAAGSALASGLRRATKDADIIAEGGDPERPSEKAMRLSSS